MWVRPQAESFWGAEGPEAEIRRRAAGFALSFNQRFIVSVIALSARRNSFRLGSRDSTAKSAIYCTLVTELIHTITLGAQTSGDDDRTGEHVLELRKLLAANCKGPYSVEISEFALVLRVGGNMQEFDFEGCERIRRNRKGKYITVDLGFPSRKWRGVSDSKIRRYLADIVETGLLCCLHRLKKDKVKVHEAKLMNDFTNLKKDFLGNG
jgi:hypothetical protein